MTRTVSQPFGVRVSPSASQWGVTQGSTPALSAFPGLRGWGYDTTHGSGRHLSPAATRVLYVDSLSTANEQTGANSGSLTWCLGQAEARVVVPRVSGLIAYPLDTVFRIDNPYLTYAGQCAPSPGLHVRNLCLHVGANDVLLWHWSSFLGTASAQASGDCIQLGVETPGHKTDIVVANANCFWAYDQSASAFNSSQSYVDRYTYWQCLFAENANSASRYGPLLDNTNGPATGYPNLPRFSMYRNAFVSNLRRNPRVGSGVGELANNLGYNNEVNVELEAQDFGPAFTINVYRNAFKKGPSGAQRSPILFEDFPAGSWQTGGYYYIAENVKSSGHTAEMIEPAPGDDIQSAAAAAAQVPGWVARSIADTDAGIDEFAQIVMNHAGARPGDRLATLERVASYVVSGSGSWVDDPNDVGGFPAVPANTIDHEDPGAHGDDPIPSGVDRDEVQTSGYTKLEEWLHRRHGDVMPAGWDR